MPLVLPALFFISAVSAATSGLHPGVLLLPGYTCSQLDARLTDDYRPFTPGCGIPKQGRGWFVRLRTPVSCRATPTSCALCSTPVAGDYRNLPGVETHVVAFGTTRGFGSNNPAQKNGCMERLVKALEGVGYREGANLFGSPYDFRYAPAPPGLPQRAFSTFVSSLRLLVEHASKRNGNKPVIIVTHSLGGFFAMEFLNQSPLPWRRRYVKHFLTLSLGIGGPPGILQVVASNPGTPPSSLLDSVLSFGNRSFASMLSVLPSPNVYGHTPLVITRAKNYSADDIPEFLSAAGLSDDVVARYRTRGLPVTLNIRAPLVPITCINSVGIPTVDKLVYWDGNFSVEPQVVYGDGDGTINLATVLALKRVIGDDPHQDYFKSVFIPNVTHDGMISDDFALKRVVGEIIEANQRL
ncbi:hypothetical protein EJB05_50318, partial [Eragrostis curvula]